MTRSVETARRGSPVARMNGAQRVWVFSGLVAAIGAGLYFGMVRHLGTVDAPFAIPWWVLPALFALAEAFVVHVDFGKNAHSFSLGEVPLVMGLFFASPEHVLLARLAGSALTLGLYRRNSLLRLSFNLSQLLLSTCAAAVVFHLVIALGDPLGPAGWAATLGATFLADGFSAVCIGLAISLSEGRLSRLALFTRVGSAFVFAATCLSMVVVLVVWHRPTASWLLPVLAASIFVAYHAYGSLKHKHRTLESLYRSTQLSREHLEVEAIVRGLLLQAKEMLRAEIAEITLLPSAEGDTALQATVGPEAAETTSRNVELDPTTGVWARVVSEGESVTLAAPIRNKRLKEHFGARGIKDVMVAPLRGDTHILGTIMVANRTGDFSTFGVDDLQALETLANHASVSLENGRLVDRLQRQAAEQEYQATHDALTGLPNRRLLHTRIEEALAEARARDSRVGVVLMDLDRFKEINDTLGHDNGDALLKETARRLERVVRAGDTVSRLGGDEFAILMRDVGDAHTVEDVARRILSVLEEPFGIDGLALELSGSIGVALFPDHGEHGTSLLQRADVAMYLAKGSRTGFEVYDQRKDVYSASRLALVGELREAIERGEIVVAYQPIADLRTGRVSAVEALVRWNHPQQGLILPGQFLPVAEHTGVIKPLTFEVLNTALRDLVEWRRLGMELSVAVNLSARLLVDADLPREVARAVDTWGVAPHLLTLEITETSIMSDPGRAMKVLEALKSVGVRLSIDDFGTGYSSLSYLKKLPVSEIKVDRSFVMAMSVDEKDSAIVRSTIELARNLVLTVVAEGVETRDSWESLIAWGCDMAQGYLLCKPAPASELTYWLQEYELRRVATASASHGTFLSPQAVA